MKCCDVSIHNELIDVGEIYCPFCDMKLQGYESRQDDSCCSNKEVIKDKGMIICRNCGSVYGYEVAREYVDFYENMRRLRRKSVYHRKYHVVNRIDFLSRESKVQLSHKNKHRIIRIFKEIDKVLPQVNNSRKRMVSIDFILKKLFDLMEISVKVSLSRSPKTIAHHNRCWESIYDLIGEDIQLIISK